LNNLPLTEDDLDFEDSKGHLDILTKDAFLKVLNKLHAYYEERFQQLYEICKQPKDK
jgi:hypothetical protein